MGPDERRHDIMSAAIRLFGARPYNEVSIAEVVQRVLSLLEREVPVTFDDNRVRPPDSEVERLVADASRARRLLGWEPEVDLTTGLERTVDWVRRRLDLYKPAVYNV